VIADCHIYDRHIPAVKAMLEKEGYEAPTFKIDTDIDDFYKFTKNSFTMENYKYHDFNFEIPMAI
jgi:thymidylate synthase